MNELALNRSRRTVAIFTGITALLVAGAWLWYWGIRLDSSGGRADAADSRQVALGELVYRDHCANCHGAQLEGQPDWRTRKSDGKLPAPPHDETGHTWHHPDDQLFRITKVGVKPPLAPEGYESDMPGFGVILADEQIWAVLAYIKSRWPVEIRARQDMLNERVSR